MVMWKRVENTHRRFGSRLWYFYIMGPDAPLLFTDQEIQRAKVRAKINREDLPAPSALVPVELTP